MDVIQLNHINQSNYIKGTLRPENANRNAADYCHYVDYVEETIPESKLKTYKNIIVFLLTLIVLLVVAIVILTASLLSKF